MKKGLLSLTLITFIFINVSAIAEKPILQGAPGILTAPTDDEYEAYTLPADYTIGPFNYVILDGTQRVCYPDTQPEFADLDVQVITVNVGNNTLTTWYCYEYNSNYFTIQP